jgi:hypothetical protein
MFIDAQRVLCGLNWMRTVLAGQIDDGDHVTMGVQP